MDFAGISWGQHGGLILDVPCLVTPYDLSILATLEPFPENGSKDLDKLPSGKRTNINGNFRIFPYIGLNNRPYIW